MRTGTPAASAGLEAGTWSWRSTARTIETADELHSPIAGKQPGDKVEITIVRDGDWRTVTVTLAERPS